MNDKVKILDIIVPALTTFDGPAYIKRWFKQAGALANAQETLVQLVDNLSDEEADKDKIKKFYIIAPTQGVLTEIGAFVKQEVSVGTLICKMAVSADYQDNAQIDWNNFDEVSSILADFADRSKQGAQKKSANDALGHILGVNENSSFQKMNVDQQNQFLQSIVNEHKSYGLSPAEMASKLLKGLRHEPPKLAPATPAPAFGLSLAPSTPGPAPGGGGTVRRPQQNPQGGKDDQK